MLQTAKSPTSYTTQDQQIALKYSWQNEKLIVVPADKENVTVVMEDKITSRRYVHSYVVLIRAIQVLQRARKYETFYDQ